MPEAEKTPDLIGAVLAATHEPFEAEWARLRDELDAGIVTAVRTAVDRHREAVESVGLSGEPPEDWLEQADRLLEYRRTFSSNLLEPVDLALRSGPARSIETAVEAAVERAATSVDDLPEAATAPWSEGALSPRPTDPSRRRLGKVFARGVSAARKAGALREVPVRNVGKDHLARLIPNQERRAIEAMAWWGEWTRRLELALSEWADSALAALVRADSPRAEAAAPERPANSVREAEPPEDSNVDETEPRDSGVEETEPKVKAKPKVKDKPAEPDPWVVLRQAASTLEAQLNELIETAADREWSAGAERELGEARTVLEGELAVAGSFLYAAASGQSTPQRRTLAKRAEAFQAWDDGVAARARTLASILAIMSGATAVQRRTLARFHDRCLAGMPDQSVAAGRLIELAEGLLTADASVPRARIDRLKGEVTDALTPITASIPDAEVVESVVREGSDTTVEALLAMIRQAPATLTLHDDDARPATGARRVDTRTVALQELARQSFDALRIERIRSATSGLIEVIDRVRTNASELPDVFTFAHDAALAEFEADEAGAAQRAVGLVTEALDSIAESLRNMGPEIEVGIERARGKLAAEISEGSLALMGRVDAGGVTAQLLAARSRFADLRARVYERWGPPVQRWLERATRRARGLWRQLTSSVRKGSALVSGDIAGKAASNRTIKTLADAAVVTERLPLVYQRLFTLDAIGDPALLVGRASELAEGRARWARWRARDGVPLIVRGHQGSGVTSYMQVLAATLGKEARTASVSLDERVRSEAGLARLLCSTLGLAECDTLDGVAAGVFDAEPGSMPDFVMIDNLEHLYLRVPKGTDLVERTLTLLAETDPRIFWVGGVTTSAWQLITTSEPTAIRQVDVLDLPSLPAEEIRAAITVRHRRSGLSWRFEQSASGRQLLRRRLRRIRDAETHEQALENDFFDQLNRTCSGHLRLALFQWMLSADFDSGEGVLIHPPERPDFSVLEALDLTQNFTLKAFLEHRTLSLEEHDDIFRLPRHESYQIFESLGNRHLIQRIKSASNGGLERSEIEVSLRYRLRPLLIGAVQTHLKARNIVH